MLTGDKLETAISIGVACRLLSPAMRALVLRNADFEGLQASASSAMCPVTCTQTDSLQAWVPSSQLVNFAGVQGYDAGQRLRRHLTDVAAKQREPESG